jgi:hypothetical protein
MIAGPDVGVRKEHSINGSMLTLFGVLETS